VGRVVGFAAGFAEAGTIVGDVGTDVTPLPGLSDGLNVVAGAREPALGEVIDGETVGLESATDGGSNAAGALLTNPSAFGAIVDGKMVGVVAVTDGELLFILSTFGDWDEGGIGGFVTVVVVDADGAKDRPGALLLGTSPLGEVVDKGPAMDGAVVEAGAEVVDPGATERPLLTVGIVVELDVNSLHESGGFSENSQMPILKNSSYAETRAYTAAGTPSCAQPAPNDTTPTCTLFAVKSGPPESP